jgi:hypothetical protein
LKIARSNRLIIAAYLIAVIGVAVVGCTSREEPSEVLVTCGNHSCGELIMVTTDTASDGFKYLDPQLSPAEDWIVFTADWSAIPSTDDPPDPVPENRQIAFIPVRENTEPVASIETLGANLMRLATVDVEFAGQTQAWSALDVQKGWPTWQDAGTVIFSQFLPRGNRLCRADVTPLLADSVAIDVLVPWEVLYYEPEDASISGGYFQHEMPALSPDGEWLAYTRTRCQDPHDPHTCDQIAIWVMQMSTLGSAQPVTFPVTSGAGLVIDPAWSGDSSRLVFAATPDLVDDPAGFGEEIFTAVFDTTGLAANGGVTLDNELQRVTHTVNSPGDPLEDTVRNYAPVFSSDAGSILFVSTRRAPSVTLRERNIWQVPTDGSLEPQIYFFTRYDDVDPFLDPYSGRILLSSAMGFPTEMLDRIQADTMERLAAEDSTLTDVEIQTLALIQRMELEFFAGVMSHLFIFRP